MRKAKRPAHGQAAAEVHAKFQEALALHQSGRLAQAQEAYRQVLKVQPEHFDALHLLGVIAAQNGDSESAVAQIGKAIAINPHNAVANYNLGVALQKLGRHEAALSHYGRAIALNPGYAEAHHNHGVALQALKRHEAAVQSYERAIVLRPDYAEAHNNRGIALNDLRQHEAAVQSYERAIAIRPNYAEAYSNRGNALQALKHSEAALQSYEKAIALKPDHAEAYGNRGNVLRNQRQYEAALRSYDGAIALDSGLAEVWYNRGIVLQDLGQDEAALQSYDRALSLKPDYADVYYNRSKALVDTRRYEEALASCDRALALNPDFSDALCNRGNALLALDRHEEALSSFDQAISAQPDHADAFSNRGNALRNLKRYDEALESYRHAIAINPDHPEAHLNEAVCRLSLGDFETGWKHYEWRFGTDEPAPSMRVFSQPRWDGTFVDGVLFAWAEQGLGDQILFAGLLNELRKCASRLIVEVEPRLVGLFRRSFPGIEIVAQGEAPGKRCFDVQIPIASIGQYFRRRWEDFRSQPSGYLVADAARAGSLREQLVADGRVVLGLSWVSLARYGSEQKSTHLRDFDPILRLPGARIIDLQYGDTSAEKTALKESTGMEILQLTEIDNRNDIDGLAALITACDAVVTVSNTTAHLAGALGKKVLLLLPYSHGLLWYWHAERDDSPWYPTARLFRQPAAGDWNSVIQRIAAELRSSFR